MYTVCASFVLLLCSAFLSFTARAETIVLTKSDSILSERVINEIWRGLEQEQSTKLIPYNEKNLKKVMAKLPKDSAIINIGDNPDMVQATASSLGFSTPIFFGAAESENFINGVSLRINATKMIKALKASAPKIKTIHTVVSKGFNKEYLASLIQLADAQGIRVEVVTAQNSLDLAKHWSEISTQIDTQLSTIALIDTTDIEKVGALHFVLKTAWKRKMVVITTVPSYTTKGVSIGVAFNLKDYGEELIRLFKQNNGNKRYSVSYTPAINIRHFKHAGHGIKETNYQDDVVFIE